jgi:hypothetical protein
MLNSQEINRDLVTEKESLVREEGLSSHSDCVTHGLLCSRFNARSLIRHMETKIGNWTENRKEKIDEA